MLSMNGFFTINKKLVLIWLTKINRKYDYFQIIHPLFLFY